MSQELPTLYKRTSGGGTQQWRIWVESGPNGVGVIHTEYGLQDGKLQHLTETIKEGKNPGKKNATTPLEQAKAEAAAKWEKQHTRKCYGLTVEASAEVRGVAAMLAQTYEDRKDEIDWSSSYIQPKLDGYRAIAERRDGRIYLRSRENKPILTMGHIAEQLEAVLGDDDILDGELYVPGLTFQKAASLIKREQADSVKVLYHVYDTMLEAPFAERYAYAVKILRSLPKDLVQLVDTHRVINHDEVMHYQAAAVEAGFEGAILRHSLTDYEAGKRSKQLLKVKTWRDAEFPIVGVTEGRGTHAGMAVFTCTTPAGYKFDVLAPGTHKEKRQAWQDFSQAGVIKGDAKMLTVKYFEMSTSEQPVPRFPVALRFAQQAGT